MTEDGEMPEERPEGRAAGTPRPADDDVDGEVDRFLGQVDDPEEIRARGAAESEPEDAEYEARMNERYEDQIEHEKEMLRQGGIDVDGSGEGMPLGSTPIAGPRYRPREVVEAAERARAEEAAADGGGASEAGAASTGPAPGGAVLPAGAEVERPGVPEKPGHGEAVVVRLDQAGQALLRNFMDVQSSAVVQWTEAIAREVKELKESVPRFATGDVKLLAAEVGKLADYLRVEQADETRRREASEASEGRWAWPLRVAAVVAVVGAFAAGAGLQARWPVLEDGTNGWKDIVWQRHGIAIAECIKRASGRDRGEVCSVSANIR